MSLLAWSAAIKTLVESKRLKIVLASASPRRKEILGSLLLSDALFSVLTSTFEETLPKDQFSFAGGYALATARGKGLEVSKRLEVTEPDTVTIVISADTVVDLNGQILEKPSDPEHAKRMIRDLSGRTHQVHTGVVIVEKKGHDESAVETCHFIESTKVTFAELSSQAIDAYVATKEPMDKAGAYGIQGAGRGLVKGIEGDFFNVVGFPCYSFASHLSNRLAVLFPEFDPMSTSPKKPRLSES